MQVQLKALEYHRIFQFSPHSFQEVSYSTESNRWLFGLSVALKNFKNNNKKTTTNVFKYRFKQLI